MTPDAPQSQSVGGFHLRDVAGSVVFEASGDIISGNKTIIQNFKYFYQGAARPLAKAPYKFLSYYDIPDYDIFFGRESAVRSLEESITRHKVVIVSGPSGAGKSSVVNAGLIPRLAQHGYDYIRFRDYTNPVDQLREHLAQSSGSAGGVGPARSLREVFLGARAAGKKALVVLDQMERYLISVPSQARQAFMGDVRNCLIGDLTSEEVNIVFVIRHEFLGSFLEEFDGAINNFFSECQPMYVRALEKREAKLAITEPLAGVPKIYFERGFVDDVLLPHLIGQSPGEGIEPPHLQIVCNRLFDSAMKRIAAGESGVEIGRGMYKELGEAEGILQGYLDDVVERAAGGSSERISTVRSILKLMIQSGGTRQFLALDEIKAALPDLLD